MDIKIREYTKEDTKEAIRIWNHIVEEWNAFPQMDCLTETTGEEFFLGQSYTGIAVDVDSGEIAGLYILHPNNVGRCVHVANASYAVASSARGLGLGRELVKDSLAQAARKGFRGLQFNVVVATNEAAIHLYEDLGFTRVGTVPGGFCNFLGGYEDMHIYYKSCVDGRRPC